MTGLAIFGYVFMVVIWLFLIWLTASEIKEYRRANEKEAK